jgi:hypothetical protein
MASPADPELSALVGRVLPKPPVEAPWTVQFVHRFEDVDASIDNTSAVVRIQPTWRQAIHQAGLAHVTRHYPLALEPIDLESPDVRDVIDPRVFGRIKLWRAITIERDYYGGLFTGALTVGEAHVAQTLDRLGAFAHPHPGTAIQEALSARRATVRASEQKERMMRLRRTRLSELLQLRLSQRKYDVSHVVPLDAFLTLLPSRMLRALTLYGSETVPLVELERYSINAVREISEDLLPTLTYQLDLAVEYAERVSPLVRGCLSDEEEIALGMLAV